MKVSKRIFGSVVVATLLATGVQAATFPSAPVPKGTNLGYVISDPYSNAPLTALIDLGGKRIKDVKVVVKGKPNGGIDVSYPVGEETINTHDGVPIIGLYQNYKNTVVVSFTDAETGKKYKDTHKILTPALQGAYVDNRNLTVINKINVKKVDKRFKNALLMTNGGDYTREGSNLVWASSSRPVGEGFKLKGGLSGQGSIAFEAYPLLYITDTQGEYRWWLDQEMLFEEGIDINTKGYMMGIHPTQNGTFTFLYGQHYGEFDLAGKLLYKHRLPRGYIDASHEIIEMPNGNLLIRVAKANYYRPDGQIVHTVRDHIIQVDKLGRLIDVWDLNKIADPYRDALLLGMDQGAVCLNVDMDKIGQTAEKFEPDAPYGDLLGIGAGRNWAHVNSIAYDPKDDSIILSFRHQGVIKITRDKKVKWILAPRVGWNKELSKKLLTPVDSKGKKINCDEKGVCEGDFDFVYTQHTAWLSPNNTLTVLDNGDGRHYTQPAMMEDKYTRFVEYKIDEKKGTVQQLWEYGKDRGYDWYSAVTSNVELITNDGKPYMYGFGGSVDLFNRTKSTKGIHNIIDYKTKDVLLEVETHSNRPNTPYYRGLLMTPNTWFNK